MCYNFPINEKIIYEQSKFVEFIFINWIRLGVPTCLTELISNCFILSYFFFIRFWIKKYMLYCFFNKFILTIGVCLYLFPKKAIFSYFSRLVLATWECIGWQHCSSLRISPDWLVDSMCTSVRAWILDGGRIDVP